MRVELGGHPDSELWGEAGLIAATMRCVDALGEVTEQRDEARGQRDRLAAALINCMPFISGEGCGEYSDAKEALQSLTPNETLSNQ